MVLHRSNEAQAPVVPESKITKVVSKILSVNPTVDVWTLQNMLLLDAIFFFYYRGYNVYDNFA